MHWCCKYLKHIMPTTGRTSVGGEQMIIAQLVARYLVLFVSWCGWNVSSDCRTMSSSVILFYSSLSGELIILLCLCLRSQIHIDPWVYVGPSIYGCTSIDIPINPRPVRCCPLSYRPAPPTTKLSTEPLVPSFLDPLIPWSLDTLNSSWIHLC